MKLSYSLRVIFLFCAFIIIAIIGFFLIPAQREWEIMSNMHQLQSRRIKIPFNEFQLVGQADSINRNNLMKVVVYLDSYVCTDCAIKNLASKWNDVIKKEYKNEGILQFLFIIASNEKNEQEVASILNLAHFGHPVYLDSSDAFIKENPHIPIKGIYHTFLLDENDSVVLVGDPFKNEKMKKLFLKVIDDKSNMQKEKNGILGRKRT